MEGDVITMQDIFRFAQTGFKDGQVLGRLQPTGIRPKFYDRIKLAGVRLPAQLFGTTLDPTSYRV
jgi:pilus assembly protein CpaF